ncbi:hypothetical protein ASD81_13255 [Nocardioides sp. Root614]|nr:hypothetical protein ASD81_13255 [Nocardioides sp. Root614]KRA89172.1 hypothetical protein ASD84_13520 [Nocardioides sp. Root682]
MPKLADRLEFLTSANDPFLRRSQRFALGRQPIVGPAQQGCLLRTKQLVIGFQPFLHSGYFSSRIEVEPKIEQFVR